MNNVIFNNDHVVNAYDFWDQGNLGDPYGNIRIINSDIYGIHYVLSWAQNVETLAIENVISNPSLFIQGANTRASLPVKLDAKARLLAACLGKRRKRHWIDSGGGGHPGQ